MGYYTHTLQLLNPASSITKLGLSLTFGRVYPCSREKDDVLIAIDNSRLDVIPFKFSISREEQEALLRSLIPQLLSIPEKRI